MDTTELKRLAQKATPGPWRATTNYVIAEETEDRLGFRLPTKNFNGNPEDGRRFGAYIAAANPAVVLALIARIEELEAAAGGPALHSAIPDARSLHVAQDDEPKVSERYKYLWRKGWNAYRTALVSAAPVTAAAPDEGEALATITLGGIEGDEYGNIDIEVVSMKVLEDMQSKLVQTDKPVFVHLYAARAIETRIKCPRADALVSAVGKLIKAKGRFHTEQNYQAMVVAYDALKGQPAGSAS